MIRQINIWTSSMRVLVLLCLVSTTAFSQNLEELGVDKGLKFNGSINLNTVNYYVNGIEQRRDPFNWFLTGNLNVNLFGYSAPLSFSYSNANRSFTQPFNQFSFAPQYKWVKTYIGYNAMTFSNYTLAGHVFLGGGVELTPGKWRIAAMHGRLRKAVGYNLLDTLQYQEASFKRMGTGLKVGYENNGDMVSANIFTAKDDVNSIPYIITENQLAPQQNVAIGITVRKKILKKFFAEVEYAISSMNTDTRANRDTEQDSTGIRASHNLIKGLLPENATNRYYDALNGSIGYNSTWYGIQMKYERVAPEYNSLGAYFFNNDMRNITLIPSVRFLKNTLNFAGNVGFQNNNLDQTRASTTKRFIGSVNATYAPNELYNFAMGYSNFSTFTNIRPLQDPFLQNTLDTLNFYQLSQTMNGTVTRNLGGPDNPQSLMFSTNYQVASDQASYEGGSQQSGYITMNGSYSYSFASSGTTLALAGNLYMNNAVGMKSTYWGPSIICAKTFMEKQLRSSLSTSYNETHGSEIKASPVLNNRLNCSYTPKSRESTSKSRHSLSLGINVVNRLKSVLQHPAFSEVTGMCNYSYTF
ncbi:MAG: hypothetical protein M3512_10530 [Bacteroidota bacterium]|nr:hypothetical protein [Bacteroidota bacterium]MDQ3534657.1 hypothetical protein [Bacteroidota bacterium]